MTEPVHSPLGASGASRWMTCPGSVTLIQAAGLGGEETEFAAEGTAAHDLAAYCLNNNLDAWERIGETHYDRIVDADMAIEVQTYLDECNRWRQGNVTTWIEYRASHVQQKILFGTMDFFVYNHDYEAGVLRDLKYGAGIAVDADTPQLKYYGLIMLHTPGLDGCRKINAGIVQPRAHHPDGPVRTVTYTSEELFEWGETVLVPAMERTRKDQGLQVGDHCRFCPARLICPALQGVFQAFATTPASAARGLPDDMLGLVWRQIEAAKIFIRAVEGEVMTRLTKGRKVDGLKLVDKYADRVYRDGAEPALRKVLGPDIYTPPELLSPAQLEKLNGKAKALVQQWAYTPKTGHTVAKESDRRPAVKVQTMKEAFKHLEAKDEDW